MRNGKITPSVCLSCQRKRFVWNEAKICDDCLADLAHMIVTGAGDTPAARVCRSILETLADSGKWLPGGCLSLQDLSAQYLCELSQQQAKNSKSSNA